MWFWKKQKAEMHDTIADFPQETKLDDDIPQECREPLPTISFEETVGGDNWFVTWRDRFRDSRTNKTYHFCTFQCEREDMWCSINYGNGYCMGHSDNDITEETERDLAFVNTILEENNGNNSAEKNV